MIMVLVFCIAKIGVFEKGFIKDGSWMMEVKVLDDRGCFESLSMTVDYRWKESRKKEKESREKIRGAGRMEAG